MSSIVDITVQHVPFVEIAIHKGLLAPIIVSDLFPHLASFTAHCYVPILSVLAKWNVLDRVPEVLSESLIPKKAPVLVIPQQAIDPVLNSRTGCCRDLSTGTRTSNKKRHNEDQNIFH